MDINIKKESVRMSNNFLSLLPYDDKLLENFSNIINNYFARDKH